MAWLVRHVMCLGALCGIICSMSLLTDMHEVLMRGDEDIKLDTKDGEKYDSNFA